VGYGLKNRALRRLRGKKHHSYTFWKELTDEDYRHLPDDIYIEGYWNEERFFCDVAAHVRLIYQFPELTDEANKKCLSRIISTNSVGIHVRRGDYVKYPRSFPMCPAGYYQKAIDLIKAGNPEQRFTFFVFSDEIDWCRKNLSFLENVQFVHHNTKTSSYKDMILLSACKHQIMANSTFSWWAAWLNPNPAKKVFYPSTTKLTYASMPESWICISE